jgi:biotin operon repressor
MLKMRTAISGLGIVLTLALTAQAHAAEIDWAKVDAALGKTASVQGEVHRYGIPRSDLQVTLDGVTIKPALALGGWVAFEPMPDGALAMGDLVLTETEVNPVMSKLLESGIEITAVHNHLMRATPATFYMHIHGHGDAIAMATAIRAALAESKTPFAAPAAPAAQATQVDLDTAALDEAIGVKGKVNGGVYQFSVPRKEPITEHGMAVPPAMGTAIAINFQPTGDGKAAITGDFVVIADEVNPLIRALRENGIEVTAIHSHMLDEQPRLFFVHFWANDDAQKLAKGLNAALEKIAVARS